MKKNKKIYKTIIILFLLVFVTGCEQQSFNFSEMCVHCNDTYIPSALATLSRNLIGLVQVMVPVIIILVGMIELVKAIMAGDEKKMDEVKPSLIKKIIAGVMIFLVIAIVKFAFGIIPSETGTVMECVSIFVYKNEKETFCPPRTAGTEVPIELRRKNVMRVKIVHGNIMVAHHLAFMLILIQNVGQMEANIDGRYQLQDLNGVKIVLKQMNILVIILQAKNVGQMEVNINGKYQLQDLNGV